MTAVTVTGGENQPAITLTFDAGRSATEATSLAGMISDTFGNQTATYISATENPGGVNSGDPYGDGYLVVTASTGTTSDPTDVHDFQAVTFDAAATVFGGSPSGQSVIAGSAGLSYSTTYSGGLIQVAGGSNVISLIGSGNTVYGGAGSDVINVGGTDTIFAGDGATTVNLTTGASVSVSGSQTSSSTLLVDDANDVSTVTGGAGTLVAYNAVGSFTGGAAGSNTIIGGTGGPVTITGGGANDDLESSSTASLITTAGIDATVDLHAGAGGDTVSSTFAGANINVGVGAGSSDVLNLGAGSTTVQVASGAVSINGGAGTLSFFGGASDSTVVGGAGSITAYVAGGSVTGGTGGSNILVGNDSVAGVAGPTLVGGGNNDYIQAGAGNSSLIAGTGAEALVAGTGSDTLVATTDANSTTNISFANVSGVQNQSYEIDNFGVSSHNSIFTANQTDANYIIANQTVVGSNLVVNLNATTTITLVGDTTKLTATNVKPL